MNHVARTMNKFLVYGSCDIVLIDRFQVSRSQVRAILFNRRVSGFQGFRFQVSGFRSTTLIKKWRNKMIYMTIDNAGQFRDAFHRAGRGNSFSYAALEVLFEHLEEGGDYELDPIELCAIWSEMDVEEVLKEYDIESIDELERDFGVVLKVNESTVLISE